MQQQATTTAEKEDGTDSTINKTTTTSEPTTSTAAKEDGADSTARIVGFNPPDEEIYGKEAYEMDTTTTMSWVTASTCENRNKTMTNNLEHWEVPNHIGVIKEDPGPCDVFDLTLVLHTNKHGSCR